MFLLILISFSCEKKLDENNVIPEITYPYDFFMNHNGLNRLYTLYKPDNLKEKAPLVFVLHGYTSNNNNIMNYSKMNEIADEYGFMVCYPQGTRNTYTGQTHWNANLKEMSSIADSDFLNDLAIKLQAEYNLSEKNTFACGMSNGGFMSYTLACQLSNRIAAIASVTGTMVTPNLNACNCQHPMPVMQIHGTADPTVPYDGNPQGFVAVEDLVDYWVAFNSCNPTATETAVPDVDMTDGCTADHFVYSGGTNGSSVEHYRVNGGGHTWPGSNPFFSIGVTNQDFSASVEIWRFLSQYTLNQLVSVDEELERGDGFTVFPNPSEGQVALRFNMNVSSTIRVYDAVGKLVFTQTSQSQTVSVDLPEAGIYFLQVETEAGIFTEKLIRN